MSAFYGSFPGVYIQWQIINMRYPIMRRPADEYLPAATPIFGGKSDNIGGRCLRPHGIRDHLLMYTTAGACQVAWDQGSLRAEPGDMVLITPWTPHDYGRVEQLGAWGVIWAVFQARPHWLDYLAWPESAPGIARLRLADPALQAAAVAHLDGAQALSKGALPNRDLLAMNALEGALLWCWNQWRGTSRIDPRIKTAVAMMCDHLADPIDSTAAAQAAGLSLPHFVRLFRRSIGTTPQRFLEDRRLEQACALLRSTPLSVQEVAQRSGFASPFYFSTRFKRRMKASPKHYRAAAAAGRI